jgi:hypothetical protein
VASAPLVQAEWAALQQLRAVGKSTKMKQAPQPWKMVKMGKSLDFMQY